MCPQWRAHWRHLANTIELLLPTAHPSPQTKRQIDRFSHFCTVHCRVSSGISPNNCRVAWRIWNPSNTCFLGPTRVHNPNGILIGPAVFAQFTSCSCGMPFPLKIAYSMGIRTHNSMWFLGSTQLRIPNGISIQPF